MKTSKLFLAVILMAPFAAGSCVSDTGELPMIDGLYPYHTFYIYSSSLWTTNTGGPNHDETIDYDMLTKSTGKIYLVDDDGLLAFGGSKQQWMLMAEEKGLPFDEPTLRSRRFAIKNVTTGRFINVKGITSESMENAVQAQQVLMSAFEKDIAFFCRINPQTVRGKGLPVISNANIAMRNSFNLNAGILCLLGHNGYKTMKPSENSRELYAIQFLYGSDNWYDPENIIYSPLQGCSLFNFTAD